MTDTLREEPVRVPDDSPVRWKPIALAFAFLLVVGLWTFVLWQQGMCESFDALFQRFPR
jgi:hypothetical protein